jgi:hypothetical protein
MCSKTIEKSIRILGHNSLLASSIWDMSGSKFLGTAGSKLVYVKNYVLITGNMSRSLETCPKYWKHVLITGTWP